MRSKRYHTSGRSWAVRVTGDANPPAPAPIQTSALDLPGEQKFGLVYLRKAGPDSVASLICRKMSEQSIPFPGGRHWYDLRREGYVTLELTGHVLTPKGNSAAGDIMRDLSRKYSIHIFNTTGGRGTGAGMMTSCSCGTFSAGPFHNDRPGESRLHTAQCGHMREVESGLWPRRTIIDFLNEVAPPQFDFKSGTVASGPENGATGKVSAYQHPVAPMDLEAQDGP